MGQIKGCGYGNFIECTYRIIAFECAYEAVSLLSEYDQNRLSHDEALFSPTSHDSVWLCYGAKSSRLS